MTMIRRHKRIEKSKTPIEEIIAKTPVDNNVARRNIWIEGVVLALPLLVSFAFYLNLVLTSVGKAEKGRLLSPPETESLVIFIFAFILIYSAFLIFEYNNLKKKLDKHKKHHRKK